MDKEIVIKSIEKDEMKPVWFPKDWQEIIKERAQREGLPIYKYLMMLSNNFEILQSEKK